MTVQIAAVLPSLHWIMAGDPAFLFSFAAGSPVLRISRRSVHRSSPDASGDFLPRPPFQRGNALSPPTEPTSQT
jgi:hypothetical protein